MFHEVMDAIIYRYGFENEITISFCQLCEKVEKDIDENMLLVYKTFCMLMEEEQ